MQHTCKHAHIHTTHSKVEGEEHLEHPRLAAARLHNNLAGPTSSRKPPPRQTMSGSVNDSSLPVRGRENANGKRLSASLEDEFDEFDF
jgi:hypothetical protein